MDISTYQASLFAEDLPVELFKSNKDEITVLVLRNLPKVKDTFEVTFPVSPKDVSCKILELTPPYVFKVKSIDSKVTKNVLSIPYSPADGNLAINCDMVFGEEISATAHRKLSSETLDFHVEVVDKPLLKKRSISTKEGFKISGVATQALSESKGLQVEFLSVATITRLSDHCTLILEDQVVEPVPFQIEAEDVSRMNFDLSNANIVKDKDFSISCDRTEFKIDLLTPGLDMVRISSMESADFNIVKANSSSTINLTVALISSVALMMATFF